MAYRHCTNLVPPFDAVDQQILDAAGDYLIGDPIKGHGPFPRSVEELRAAGVVGIYIKADAFRNKRFRALTGWGMNVLGQMHRPIGADE